jgi:hypothetical protein
MRACITSRFLTQFFLTLLRTHLPFSSLPSFPALIKMGFKAVCSLLLLLWAAACASQEAAPIVSSDTPVDPDEFVNRIVSQTEQERGEKRVAERAQKEQCVPQWSTVPRYLKGRKKEKEKEVKERERWVGHRLRASIPPFVTRSQQQMPLSLALLSGRAAAVRVSL